MKPPPIWILVVAAICLCIVLILKTLEAMRVPGFYEQPKIVLKSQRPLESENAIQPATVEKPMFSVAGVAIPPPIVQISKVDSTLLDEHGFQSIGGGAWFGYALSHDHNGVILDSFPVFVLSDKALDVNRDGKVNILDITIIVNFLFRGAIN